MIDGQPIDETCRCGRLLLKPHCWRCGSYQLYAMATRETVTRGHGKLEHIRAYRCRMCAIYFNDDDREKCEAPKADMYGRRPYRTRARPDKPKVVFQSLDEAPPILAQRVAEIKKLKDEGKW